MEENVIHIIHNFYIALKKKKISKLTLQEERLTSSLYTDVIEETI